MPSGRKQRMRDAARELRKEMTPTEKILWEAVRGNRLDGRKFRRQQAIGPFVVDFYRASERLVVEVDGDVHLAQEDADRRRQEALEALGLHFVRLSARQVASDLPSALAVIRQAFGRIPFRTRTPEAARIQDPWPGEEALTEFQRTDPATRWMLRMQAEGRFRSRDEAAVPERSSPLPHPSPPVGEGPGAGPPPPHAPMPVHSVETYPYVPGDRTLSGAFDEERSR